MVKRFRLKSEFSRNVITLITGTSIAQALPIATAPILTRIFSPEDFGLFAFYLAAVSILAIIATARYELAIILPNKRDDAYQITVMSCVITSVVSLITLVLIWILENEITELLNNASISNWLYWIPVSVFLTGTYQSFYYWFNREKGYRKMANSRIIQGSGMVFTQIGFGIFTKLAASGLVLGHVIGQMLSSFYMGKVFLRETRSEHNPKKLKQIALARRFKNFPKFLMIAHAMNLTSRQLPNIFFNILFTTAIAGFYMLIQRVIGGPLAIVGGAIGDVFRQEASRAYLENGECTNEYKNTFIKLLLISLMPFGIFIFVAPDLFALVFGEDWREAGIYAQILTPMFLLQFITNPLSAMFLIVEKQKLDLLWQSCLLTMTGAAFLIGYVFRDVILTITLFSAAYTLMYTINGLITWKFAKGIK